MCKYKYNTLILLIIIIVADNVFGIVDADSIHIQGVFNIDFIWQIALFAFSLFLFIKYRLYKQFQFDLLNICIILLLISCFIAAFRCMQLTGQPILTGILPQRGFIICLFALLLLRYCFTIHLLDYDYLVRVIIIIGSVVSVLYLCQAFLHINIFSVQTGERYGSVRLYVKNCFPNIAGIFSFYKLMKTGLLKYVIPSSLALCLSLFVSKGRLELVGLTVTYLAIYLLVKNKINYKFLIGCLFILLFICFLFSDYGKQVLVNFNPTTGDDTSSIREAGKTLYRSQLNDSIVSWIFGCGYPNTLYTPAAVRAGFNNNYLLVDNGITAFAYVHGHFGLLLVLFIAMTTICHIIKESNYKRIICLSLIFFYSVLATNIVWWWWSSTWQVFSAISFAYFTSNILPIICLDKK